MCNQVQKYITQGIYKTHYSKYFIYFIYSVGYNINMLHIILHVTTAVKLKAIPRTTFKIQLACIIFNKFTYLECIFICPSIDGHIFRSALANHTRVYVFLIDSLIYTYFQAECFKISSEQILSLKGVISKHACG